MTHDVRMYHVLWGIGPGRDGIALTYDILAPNIIYYNI